MANVNFASGNRVSGKFLRKTVLFFLFWNIFIVPVTCWRHYWKYLYDNLKKYLGNINNNNHDNYFKWYI